MPGLAMPSKVASFSKTDEDNAMAKTSEWAGKVMAIIKSGNTNAAVAQIKVAPTVKDLQALQMAMVTGKLVGRWRDVDRAVEDNLVLLSAPRLHRSP